MIEFFWNRLMGQMVYGEHEVVGKGVKEELVGLIEYLPQHVLVMNAESIAPIVIYETVRKGREGR